VNPDYKLYHPKWYRPRMPIFWWLGKLSYTKFIVRELTSLAVGYAAVMLIIQIRMLSRGSDAYGGFVAWLQTPFALIVHTLVLLVLLVHTITWLNLAPKALVLRIGGRRVPDEAVLVGHYLAWIAASVLVVFYLRR
jgi:fumarate reductase subunit C